jgi:hypothetical protein
MICSTEAQNVKLMIHERFIMYEMSCAKQEISPSSQRTHFFDREQSAPGARDAHVVTSSACLWICAVHYFLLVSQYRDHNTKVVEHYRHRIT